MLAALFSGNVVIWNYVTETSVKTFECCDVPGTVVASRSAQYGTYTRVWHIVRAAKFIPRKHWIICGADVRNQRYLRAETRVC